MLCISQPLAVLRFFLPASLVVLFLVRRPSPFLPWLCMLVMFHLLTWHGGVSQGKVFGGVLFSLNSGPGGSLGNMELGFGLYDDTDMATLPQTIALMGNSFMVG